jgi:hypothetical protein
MLLRYCLLLVFAVLPAVAAAAMPEVPGYPRYAALLAKYVQPAGVDYHAWAEAPDDLAALDQVLESWSEVEVAQLSDAAQQAFFINLYNAAMLQAVFRHWPVTSVTEIAPNFGIFKRPLVQQGGQRRSLDEIEKGILLARWEEPRHHFAVNCASESCPPLRAEPFTGADLERQLQEQAERFLNSRQGAMLDPASGTVRISALFDWYASDFPGENPVAYLNRFREVPLPLGQDVAFMPYDWSLNDVSNRPN